MKKYSIIYADPPWAYRTYSKKGQGRSAESHYPTMCIEDIKALPVGELAAKDCALFLWITFPCLCEALEVLTAWGFSYKTVAFVWVKQNRRNDDLFTGMGYWTRANAEICILATKGHPKRVDAGVRQVILSHIEEHSKKPDEARERIVRLMGDLPRVELFARQSPEGWDVWGNEVECTAHLSYGGNTMLRLKPISLRDANEYVRKYHRHHKPVAGHKFSIGCEADGELVGVIIAGRPVSRYLDDGFTLEVTRLCTNGAKNACSFLYGAAARAAAAMGYKRIITYTLESENGASLRASGWICQGKAGGLRWTGKRQPKEDQYPAQMKLRYEKQLRKEETVNGICSGPEGS